MPIGAILPAIGSLIGGLFGQSSADKRADKDRQAQLDAAKHGVEWRVKDATAAGIHPLAALGMSPISISPVSVGNDASTFSQIGQDVGRAAASVGTGKDRAGQLALSLAETQVEGAKLDNDIKRAELASRIRRSMGPAAAGSPVVPMPTANTARGGDVGGQLLPTPFGFNWRTSGSATSEEWERQYGDTAQELYGVSRFGRDLLLNGGIAGRDLVKMVHDNPTIKSWDDAVLDAAAELFGVNPAY